MIWKEHIPRPSLSTPEGAWQVGSSQGQWGKAAMSNCKVRLG